jgi:putative endonuclease
LTNEAGDPIGKDAVGAEGERLAAIFLRSEGMKILWRNFRANGGGEVDIVARDRETLVFAEVKTRTSLFHGRPIEAVTMDKRYLITRGALEWLRMLDFAPRHFRFDVVEVILVDGKAPDLNLVRDAFELPEPYIY